jgi:DNA replication protein DnaC
MGETLATEQKYPCGEEVCYACPASVTLKYLLEELQKSHKLLHHQREHPEDLLEAFGIPKKYLHSSFSNFEGGEAVKEFCTVASKHGDNVLLTGNAGCGKTHLAAAMVRLKIVRQPILLPKNSVIFTTASDLLLKIRNSFCEGEEKEIDIVDRYSEVPLLILDDLGAEKVTEWTQSTLYLIIDHRNRDQRWTIVTSNLTLPEIEQVYGARIASRLSEMKVVSLKLPDYRKRRKSEAKNEKL